MKRHWMALAAGLSMADGAHAVLDNAAAEALMKKDGCAACHEVDKKLIGPAFQDVAARYRGDPGAALDVVHAGSDGSRLDRHLECRVVRRSGRSRKQEKPCAS